MTIASQHDDEQKLTIKINNDTSIMENDKIKLLGFHINRQNNMDSQLTLITLKVGMSMAKIRPALPYLSESNKNY